MEPSRDVAVIKASLQQDYRQEPLWNRHFIALIFIPGDPAWSQQDKKGQPGYSAATFFDFGSFQSALGK